MLAPSWTHTYPLPYYCNDDADGRVVMTGWLVWFDLSPVCVFFDFSPLCVFFDFFFDCFL